LPVLLWKSTTSSINDIRKNKLRNTEDYITPGKTLNSKILIKDARDTSIPNIELSLDLWFSGLYNKITAESPAIYPKPNAIIAIGWDIWPTCA
jgi:hypothetical protein